MIYTTTHLLTYVRLVLLIIIYQKIIFIVINITTMVLDYLHTYLIPLNFDLRDTNNLRNKITFEADNCTDENKNNTIIYLVNLLAEGGYFARVEIVFLIKD